MFHALYCFFDLWRERGMQGVGVWFVFRQSLSPCKLRLRYIGSQGCNLILESSKKDFEK